MKTATHKKSTAKKAQKAASPKMKSREKSGADAQLAEVAGRLGAHLKELEKEYVRLEAELRKKKALREKLQAKRAKNPAWSDEVARRRAARLQRNIDKSGAYVQKQSAFLRKVKAFHERNERMLQMIAERLGELETQLSGPNGATPAARERFQSELLGMLAELQAMRQKREKLQASAE